jgi:hypothetical protein
MVGSNALKKAHPVFNRQFFGKNHSARECPKMEI